MKNTISLRVHDFLRNFPPFNEFNKVDLLQLSEQIGIVYKDKDEVIFEENESQHTTFYVVHKGAVQLNTTDNTIVDICDEGDIFGLRPLMANENYKLKAIAYEETILYALPIVLFKTISATNPAIGNFLIESFASNTRNPYSKENKGVLTNEITSITNLHKAPLQHEIQDIKLRKKIVKCAKTSTIKSIAIKMNKKKVAAMLIVENKLPIGIITDKDIRNKIATGDFAITDSASAIMTSPVITYSAKMTLAQAQMAMMKSSISHICITVDGTVNTEAIGILSKHDLMLAVGNNPSVLIKEIKRAKNPKQLKRIRQQIQFLLQGYLEQNIPLGLISKIIAELNDACMKQVLKITLDKLEEPPVTFAWLAIGSQGRSEQLLHTDQDNALIYNDVAEEDSEKVKAYFLNLSKQATHSLKAIGYEYCPADMMASNPKWCLSLTEWKNITTHWITNPGKDEVLLSSIFFDYNFIFGDATLVSSLSDHIFTNTVSRPIFFTQLAAGALQNPSPTGFFRSFLVEADGAYKDQFDVKRRALMPLVDAARVLILSHQIKLINNTAERFEKLAELEPNNRDLYLSCSYATKALLKFRTKHGLRHNNSGRFIVLAELTKEEKIKLKQTFKTIKGIQEVLRLRFKTNTILA